MMRAYVDTNILVDLVLARQEFLPNAQRVFGVMLARCNLWYQPYRL